MADWYRGTERPKGSERSDRYLGYMGETLYFMRNAEKAVRIQMNL